jgi:heme-degrading monooxygenase HmoA
LIESPGVEVWRNVISPNPIEVCALSKEITMYGTVAFLRFKPGMDRRVQEVFSDLQAENIPGLVFEQVYRSDADPKVYVMVVGFTSREDYRANAASPEQHARYLALRELLATDPDWHDGEIVYRYSSS